MNVYIRPGWNLLWIFCAHTSIVSMCMWWTCESGVLLSHRRDRSEINLCLHEEYPVLLHAWRSCLCLSEAIVVAVQLLEWLRTDLTSFLCWSHVNISIIKNTATKMKACPSNFVPVSYKHAGPYLTQQDNKTYIWNLLSKVSFTNPFQTSFFLS